MSRNTYLWRSLKVGAALLLILGLGVWFLGSNAELAWRFKVLQAKVSGKIPEIPLSTLVKWMKPHSSVYLGAMASKPNVHASIVNSEYGAAAAEKGAHIYGQICEACHGENGMGRNAPDLIAAVTTLTDWSFLSTVKWGRPNTIMKAQPLTEEQIWQVNTFLKRSALERAHVKIGQGENLPAFAPISSERLLSAAESSDWLTYAGSYSAQRHAAHSQIARDNVQNLRLAWAAQLNTNGAESSSFEATPIVTAGRMYVSESPDGVTALDARTGALLWQFHRSVPGDISLCCGSQNRGVAVFGDSVFVGTLDAHLIALNALTGEKRWDIQVAGWRDGYSITGAPVVVGQHIVLGVGGGDFGSPGAIFAFSPNDGSLVWKFNTIPGRGQPGYETWPGDSANQGGAGTWATGAYDPSLGLIYWGTGNPSPAYTSSSRKGANLYSDSVVAIDVSNGQLRWYFQFTPNDDHDWDSTQQPVLADISFHGEVVPVLLFANRNGFFYVLDRRTGKFLFAKPFAKQTWADSIDSEGRPVVRSGAHPSRLGTLVWPAAGGATNWWPPSFDPVNRLFFVPTANAASIYFDAGSPRFNKENPFDSVTQVPADQPATMSVQAIDAATGEQRWSALLAEGGGTDIRRESGGLLSTNGGLVFAGYEGDFIALDARTGKKLWDVPLGSNIHAPPITYVLQGRQYVSLMAGQTLFTFTLPDVGASRSHAPH